jgi:hypothetical protein
MGQFNQDRFGPGIDVDNPDGKVLCAAFISKKVLLNPDEVPPTVVVRKIATASEARRPSDTASHRTFAILILLARIGELKQII